MPDTADYTVRTREEIAEQVAERSLKHPIGLGFWAEVLIFEMTLDQAAPYLKVEFVAACRAGEKTWEVSDLDADRLHAEAIDYLDFAYGKARDHRGISAWRSIEKMAAHCWLLGADRELVTGPDHAQYGAPGLRAAAAFLGHAFPSEGPLARMADGLPCRDGCNEGCSRPGARICDSSTLLRYVHTGNEGCGR